MVKGGGAGVEQGKSSSSSSSALMAELARALDLAQQLESHLSRAASAPPESRRRSTAEILSAIQKSILMAQSSAATGSPPSAGASPPSEGSGPAFGEQDRKEMMKKRKTLDKWTNKVRLSPTAAGGVEGPVDDGHSWRKYGQKDILGAKHPRAYYRCTYQNTQGCPAAKQVQRSDDDPLLFDVTYMGTHSCRRKPPKGSASTPPATKHSPNLLLKFQSELRVKTEYSPDAEEAPAEISSLIGACSPDSDLTDIIGRPNSASNSSLVGMDFLLDELELELELEQSFQLDASSFFS